MFAIDQSLSLFIPRVFSNIRECDIMRIFESLGLGIVNHVDFITRKGKNGMYYNSVYIHFIKWFDSITVENFQKKVINPKKEARVVYDDPWFWIVLPNTAAKIAPSCVPFQHLEWEQTSGFPSQQSVNPPFDGKKWLESCGFTNGGNFNLRAVRSTCDAQDNFPQLVAQTVGVDADENTSFADLLAKSAALNEQSCFDFDESILVSKFARDTADKEIAELREEIEKYKKMLEEETNLRKDTEIDWRFSRELHEYCEQENVKLEYQLNERDCEIYQLTKETQFLTGQVSNLKDELQASFAENDELREEHDRLLLIIMKMEQQDTRISDETIISELNSENVFIKHQLETRSNELASRSNDLYLTRCDNTLLNSEVYNLKDELKAAFAENDKIREDFDKLKREYEKLNKKNESTV